jgi:murein DD-endopeptidase MepM/ murein hydrolase activator NlpD
MQKEEKELNFIRNKIQAINNKLEENNALLKQNIALWQKNNIYAESKDLLLKSQELVNLIPQITNQYILEKESNKDLEIKKHAKQFLPPTSGFLQQSFNYGGKQSLFYNGLLFISMPNSNIVAPFDGEVLYTKNTKVGDIENLIIIKHSTSYISIIIGNFNILAKPTQLVKKGEIVALVDKKITPVYYEFNYKNKPQNPSLWLVGSY